MTNPLLSSQNLPLFYGAFISVIPLLVYIATFDEEDDGAWMGFFGKSFIKMLRGMWG